ncbi:MAG: PleD family two-component system response regulator [Anaerolineae bacterium]|nr:PleD family two-component system response regulator [Anaerolineae bacterium]
MDGQKTILIIDDTPANIEVLAEVLGLEYEILFATSGAEGLHIASEQLPDLILLDIMMPEMDGYEVCYRLKQEPLTQNIPVIFVTALNEEVNEAKGLEAGAIDYITKPIRPAIVRARVRNHMELKRYRDLLERMAHLDGLTGIANRRQFDRFLRQEWRRSLRNQSPLSLIMIDIDHFKLYNDTYGHLAGDDCLRQVAKALEGTLLRPADLVARYGGEEFACILPETDLSGATVIAYRLKENVEALNIPHSSSPTAPHITISLGTTTLTAKRGLSPDAMIGTADRLLYQAKASGRNCVVAMRQD